MGVAIIWWSLCPAAAKALSEKKPQKLFLKAEHVFSLKEEVMSLILKCDLLLEDHYLAEKLLDRPSFTGVIELYNTCNIIYTYIKEKTDYLDQPENKSLQKIEIGTIELEIMSALLKGLEQLKSQLAMNNIVLKNQ